MHIEVHIEEHVGEADNLAQAVWAEDSFVGQNTEVAAANSGLASAWQPPFTSDPSDSGSLIVAFQDTNQEVAIVNYTQPSPIVAIKRGGVMNGTSLSLNLEAPDTRGLSLALENQGVVYKAGWPGSSLTSWSNSYKDPLVTGDSADDFQLSSGLLIPGMVDRGVLVIALMPSGTIGGAYWRGSWTSYAVINCKGGPSVNFSSVAITSDGRFYGISNDSVLEYTIDVDQTVAFNYIGIVYP